MIPRQINLTPEDEKILDAIWGVDSETEGEGEQESRQPREKRPSRKAVAKTGKKVQQQK